MQVRKTVTGYWSKGSRQMPDDKYELVVGSNTGDPDAEARIFAVGRILSPHSTQWFHLDISDVRAIIKAHEDLHKKHKTKKTCYES